MPGRATGIEPDTICEPDTNDAGYKKNGKRHDDRP